MADVVIHPDRPAATTRPLSAVIAALVIAALVGAYFFLSAAESTVLVDGAIEWSQESPLRAIVQLLCLNYGVPTLNAGDVKLYILGIATGLAMFAVAASLTSEARVADATIPAVEESSVPFRRHLSARSSTQLLAVLYVLWSFASARWSAAPSIAIGGSVLLAILFAWSLTLAHGLTPAMVRILLRVLVVICGATALISICYFYGRNPNLRAKFPFGNPNFLAAALIPGVLGAVGILGEEILNARERRNWRSAAWVMAAGLVIIACLWALRLSDSRGAYVGLTAGVLAFLFFSGRRAWKISSIVLALVIAAIGYWYYTNSAQVPGAVGRSATMRFRLYAWSYAWRMFLDHPLTGSGQGGFVLQGDRFTADDVLRDPTVFTSRIEHAHSEWLEVLADLGIVGFLLVGLWIVLTVRAAVRALRAASPSMRWTILSLLAALVALVVEESFGVGLRVPDVPPVFFTILGLLWAASRMENQAERIPRWPRYARFAAVVAVGAGAILALAMTQQDFGAARHAFIAAERLEQRDYEGAVKHAKGALSRLAPQRAITALMQLGDAHVSMAEAMLSRATDRSTRASDSEMVNAQLLQLAEADFRAADHHSKEAAQQVKEVVSYAPGFLGTGQLEYRVNAVMAGLAAARRDVDAHNGFWRAAVGGLEREVARQPFDPALVAFYVRSTIAPGNAANMLEAFARPLRFNRIGESYVQVLQLIVQNIELAQSMQASFDDAHQALAKKDGERSAIERWAPEKLRVGAALRFISGDSAGAAGELAVACPAYAMIPDGSIGAVGCYAEWADAQFFAKSDDPSKALEIAAKGLGLSPLSEAGREMRAIIQQRMIHYHLAAGDETSAMNLLRESAPRKADAQMLQRELGIRLRRLSESLLVQAPHDSAPSEAAELRTRAKRWLERTMELAPSDAGAYFLYAQLAFEDSDDAGVESRLARALDNGLSPARALDFLTRAAQRRSLSSGLEALRTKLAEVVAAGAPTETHLSTPQ